MLFDASHPVYPVNWMAIVRSYETKNHKRLNEPLMFVSDSCLSYLQSLSVFTFPVIFEVD